MAPRKEILRHVSLSHQPLRNALQKAAYARLNRQVTPDTISYAVEDKGNFTRKPSYHISKFAGSLSL